MQIVSPQPVTDDLKKVIDDGLDRFSTERMGVNGFRGKQVAFVARNDNGDFQGAVTAAVFWGQLHIKNVLVEKDFRGQGIASRLMQSAHVYGVDQGCSFSFLETMSFQAEGFYKKLGYVTELRRAGYREETAFIYMRKDLKDETYA